MLSLKTILRKTVFASAAIAVGATAQAASPRDVINGYADIALAKYSDSLAAAEKLDAAIKAFVAEPSDATLQAAKEAWLVSRVPYQQSEVYRFGNAVVDDWEGKVNAWPLDEGLIDYVDTSYYGEESEENALFRANVVANPTLTFGGKTIDASEITPALLQELHEVDGVEANVATGYHAIEFLLWGQDTNGTEAGAGSRPYTDFAKGDACTNDNCDRRAAYLTAASDLLLADLKDIVAAWGEGGDARASLAGQSDSEGLSTILTGMGSLSYGELAGERMKLGLILHDPEEEHDCFADNTHNSHYYDALGIQNIYHGIYKRPDGSEMKVASLSELTKSLKPEIDAEMTAKLGATMDAMAVLKERADSGKESYDQMIGQGNDEGNAVVQAAIDALVDQTKSIEKVVSALNASEISVEGSDSLDNPTAVFE